MKKTSKNVFLNVFFTFFNVCYVLKKTPSQSVLAHGAIMVLKTFLQLLKKTGLD